MSRYTKKVANIEYAWGYDEPLTEYFFQALKTDAKDDEDDVIFSISSYFSMKPHPDYPNKFRYSNGEILEIMEKYPDIVPEQHKNAIGGDLTF